MASQRILATPPSQEIILNSLLENVREYNARLPHLYVGLRECALNAEMPLLLNQPGARLACREPPAEFETVNAHFSAQVHAFFNALHALETMSANQFPDELPLIRQDDGLRPTISIVNQSFDIYSDCFHRMFHTRRLTVPNLDRLPFLNRVTQLRVFPAPNYSADPGMESIHMRPLSPRTPFELAARFPNLRELDCPWLWEHLTVAFASQALCRYTRPWEGPWRDARAEFGRGVREVMPLLPASLVKVRFLFWKHGLFRDEMYQVA